MLRNWVGGLLACAMVSTGFAAEPGANPRFAVTEKQLDRDGDVYVYLNIRPFLDYMGGIIGKLRDVGLKAAEAQGNPEEVAKVKGFLDLGGSIIHDIGLTQFGDFGLSVRATGDGLFRTRYFLSRRTPADNGLLWRSMAGDGDSLPGLALFPRDSVFASASRLNVGDFWAGVKEIIAKTPVAEPFNQGIAEAKTNGVDIEAILASIGDEFAFAVALDQTRTLELPVVGAIPEPSVLVGLRIKDRTIPLLLTMASAGMKDMISQTNVAEGVSATLITPPNAPPQVLPAWAEHNGWLLLGNHPDVLAAAVARLAGKQPGLAANAEYQKYARGLPAKGSSLVFMSTRLVDVYTGVITAMMENAPSADGNPMPKEVAAIMKDLFGGMRDQFGLVAVSQSTEDGMLTTMQGPWNYSISVGSLAMLVPVAVVAVTAGAVIPAVTMNKAKAQEAACQNNLRQINSAFQQHLLENPGKPMPTVEQLGAYFEAGELPACPQGGTYTLPATAEELPTCDHPGHALAPAGEAPFNVESLEAVHEAATEALTAEPPVPVEAAVPELTPAQMAAQAKAEHKQCKEHLRVINKAAQRYMIDNGASGVPHPSALLRLLPGQAYPECPSGGTYFLPDGPNGLPRCDHPGHSFN